MENRKGGTALIFQFRLGLPKLGGVVTGFSLLKF